MRNINSIRRAAALLALAMRIPLCISFTSCAKINNYEVIK